MTTIWQQADEYYEQLFIEQDAALDNTLLQSEQARLFPIAVSPNQGKFLYLQARMLKAQRILEIGTLGGYSAIWMAKALGDNGKLITIEKQQHFVKVARNNIKVAPEVADKIEVIEGEALPVLSSMIAEGEPAFDLIFIDANKADNHKYFEAALKLSKIGTLIIADNIIRNGDIINNQVDPAIRGIMLMNEQIAQEPRVSACALQTVGSKGYDGMSLIYVIA